MFFRASVSKLGLRQGLRQSALCLTTSLVSSYLHAWQAPSSLLFVRRSEVILVFNLANSFLAFFLLAHGRGQLLFVHGECFFFVPQLTSSSPSQPSYLGTGARASAGASTLSLFALAFLLFCFLSLSTRQSQPFFDMDFDTCSGASLYSSLQLCLDFSLSSKLHQMWLIMHLKPTNMQKTLCRSHITK